MTTASGGANCFNCSPRSNGTTRCWAGEQDATHGNIGKQEFDQRNSTFNGSGPRPQRPTLGGSGTVQHIRFLLIFSLSHARPTSVSKAEASGKGGKT